MKLLAILLGAVCLSAQTKGPSLIQPLAELEKSIKGKIEKITVHAKSLEGNLEGDSADRDVFVYLPPSYATSGAKRYPVVYTLHGYGLHAQQWVGFANVGGLERAIAAGNAKEMILVAPDAFTIHNGSFYSNSQATGDWESFVAQELVAYIDSHYRTLANRASRGLAGHSMGGYGTFRIGMKHPEVYAAIYSMSAGGVIETAEPSEALNAAAALTSKEEILKLPYQQKSPFARAAAWSANPNHPPLFIDLPVKDGKPVEAVAAKWRANSILSLLAQGAANLKKFKALQMDVGLDDNLVTSNRELDAALTKAGVTHAFETFPGGHDDQVPTRFETKVLPFFSKNLEDK